MDKFNIYFSFDWQTPVIHIGTPPTIHPITYSNPIKTALLYNELINSEFANQASLARHMGVSRAKISQTFNLLKLPEEIQQYILALTPTNETLKKISERKLRAIVKLSDRKQQIEKFKEIVNGF